MNSTTPQDLLDLKSRIDQWRNTRRFIRQAMPDDIRLAAAAANQYLRISATVNTNSGRLALTQIW